MNATNQTHAGNIFIPEYMEALQQPREVKVTYVEDPIKVTSGNLRNQDTFVVDSSISETVRGGARALPHVYDGSCNTLCDICTSNRAGYYPR